MKLCESPGHMILAPDYPDQSTAYCVTCATGGVINSPAEQAAYKAFRQKQDAKPEAKRWDHIP